MAGVHCPDDASPGDCGHDPGALEYALNMEGSEAAQVERNSSRSTARQSDANLRMRPGLFHLVAAAALAPLTYFRRSSPDGILTNFPGPVPHRA